MRGRGKGSEFERSIAKELSLWWSEGQRDDIFWRTSQSGGRSKTRVQKGKRTFGQYGDLQAVDPIGRPLMELVTLELKKGYSREPAFNAVDNLPRGGKQSKSQWSRFVDQAVEDSTNAGTPYWLLIHKRDQRATVVFMPWGCFCAFPGLALAHPWIRISAEGHHQIYGTTLTEFKSRVSPEQVRKVAIEHLQKKRRVIRVRRCEP